MKFRLAFMLDLITPNDIEEDCSCKIRGGRGEGAGRKTEGGIERRENEGCE